MVANGAGGAAGALAADFTKCDWEISRAGRPARDIAKKLRKFIFQNFQKMTALTCVDCSETVLSRTMEAAKTLRRSPRISLESRRRGLAFQ